MATTTESTQTTQIVMKHRGKCGDDCRGMQHYSLVELAAGQMFRQWLETGMTYEQLYAYWNTQRNGKVIAKRFAPFVAASRSRAQAQAAILKQSFYRSVKFSRQPAA